MNNYDVVIIGGGAAGLTVAGGSAKLGLKVALVEKEKLGGDCLYYGCVPSKTLIRSAKIASLIRRAKDFGLKETALSFEFENVINHVWDVIHKIEEHDNPERFRKMGVDVIFGNPRFISPEEIIINEQVIKAKKFVISTGSKPSIPQIDGLRETGFITNVEAFHLKKLPASIVVIGAGPVGMEMSQAFRRFGAEVSVIEVSDRILPIEDVDISQALKHSLSREGIKFFTGAKVKRIYSDNGGKIAVTEQNGVEVFIRAEEILVATGRSPNIEGLNLEAAGVKYNGYGIDVDRRLKTTSNTIWACGDVVGPYLFTHMAEYQAFTLLKNALLKLPVKVDYSIVPWTTFTDPEVAHVGITETQAQEKGIKYDVYKYPFDHVDRALTEVESGGFIKIITTGWRGKIIGAQIIGYNAGELISELVLAIKNNLSVNNISSTIHVYPTLALGTRQASDQFFLNKLDSSRWIQKLIRLYVRLMN